MELQANEVSFRYGSREALKNLSFRLKSRQFHGLLGPNGSGKTTLFGLITRLLALQQGQIRLGRHLLDRHATEAMKSLGVVFQQSALDPDLTVLQNLEYHGALQGMNRKDRRQAIDREMARFGLEGRAGTRVRALNGGHQRRVELARALLHSPSLLILDEPTTGLDLDTRHGLICHIHQLCRDEGLTVLWATHLVDEIWPKDNVLLLHEGRLKMQGIAETLCHQTDSADLRELVQTLGKAQP